MGKVVLAGIFTLAASASLAQTDEQNGAGGPANLCQELLAFMTAPPEEEEATAAPAQSSAARPVQGAGAPAAETEEPPAATEAQQGGTPEDETAAAGEDSAPASGEAVPPQSVEETQSAQEASGQTGPAHGAPEQSSESGEGGEVENAELKSSLSAPVPTDGESAPKDSVMSVAEAEELAEANDIAECQNAARELRLAGVDMPDPLLALTALDLQYHRTADTEPQAPEAPAAGQQQETE